MENNRASYIPSLDLHGMDREITRILVKEFIHDSYKMGYETVIIIHGIGTGVLKNTVREILKREKMVKNFYLDFFNIGTTVVKLKK